MTEVPDDVLIEFAIRMINLDGEVEGHVPMEYKLDGTREAFRQVTQETATHVEVTDHNELMVHGEIETKEIIDRIRATWWDPPAVKTRDVVLHYLICIDLTNPEVPTINFSTQ
jgi:hypothetical protein